MRQSYKLTFWTLRLNVNECCAQNINSFSLYVNTLGKSAASLWVSHSVSRCVYILFLYLICVLIEYSQQEQIKTGTYWYMLLLHNIFVRVNMLFLFKLKWRYNFLEIIFDRNEYNLLKHVNLDYFWLNTLNYFINQYVNYQMY